MFQIQHIFEESFQERADMYEAVVSQRTPVGCLSGDHTFRVGKNVSGFREIDEKLIKDKTLLFLVLDATQHIVNWTLTKSAAHEEITETLSQVSN